MTTNTWFGALYSECEICQVSLKDKLFIDGKTVLGPWAIMCQACHKDNGGRLGVGHGQAYQSHRLVNTKEGK